MKRTAWLVGVGLVLALGPGAGNAVAASEAAVGASSLRVEAVETVPPGDPTNTVVVRQSGTNFTVTDASGITSGNVGAGCRNFDPNTVVCPGPQVTSIQVQLKSGNDTLTLDPSVTVATTVLGGPGDDQLNGGNGNDTMRGDAGRDTVRGNAGDDRIDVQGLPGQAEPDVVNCGAGNDTAITDGFDGFENPLANPPGGCESINPGTTPPPPPPPPPATGGSGGGGGGGGQAPSIFQPAVTPIQQNQPIPSSVPPVPRGFACTAEIFLGTAGADRFLGTPGGNRMVGLAGNDLMDGVAGQDCIYGGDGNDVVRAGDGNDRVSAGNGNDRADGGAGADSVYGAAGTDNLLGRDGNDLVSAGAGNDRASGGAGRDRILAGAGRDTVNSGDGNDVIDVRDGSRDVVNCGAGRDIVRRDSRDVLRSCERRVDRLPRAS